jgi:hypothetical protein
VDIKNNRFYEHSTCRILYTTYDQRRASDTVNPRSHADVMVNATSDDPNEPYWYARVIGIYHADIAFRTDRRPHQRMDFLHVRWLCSPENGLSPKRLPKVGFFDCSLPEEVEHAFGFLDPSDVLRGVHLLPVFHGPAPQTNTLLGHDGPSIARRNNGRDRSQWMTDWSWFYVNMCVLRTLFCALTLTCSSFVDRDMFARFLTLMRVVVDFPTPAEEAAEAAKAAAEAAKSSAEEANQAADTAEQTESVDNEMDKVARQSTAAAQTYVAGQQQPNADASDEDSIADSDEDSDEADEELQDVEGDEDELAEAWEDCDDEV